MCPSRCLNLVPMEDLTLTDEQRRVAALSMGEGWETGSAMIKDEEPCIRCALCAERCPADAITMERMAFSEEWS